MILPIQLISRFLDITTVISICKTCKTFYNNKQEILNFYFNESMFLTMEDKQNILLKKIPRPLYMRMYHRDALLGIILSNEFMNNKLKVQIYNGVKHNNPKFLLLYNKFFDMVLGNSIEFYVDMYKIMPLLPLKIGNYEFNLSSNGEFLIYFNNKCVGRNHFSDSVKIIEHYGLKHIISLLKSPFILETIYDYKHLPERATKTKHIRPRCKIRKIH
jgi:hypothetical protein